MGSSPGPTLYSEDSSRLRHTFCQETSSDSCHQHSNTFSILSNADHGNRNPSVDKTGSITDLYIRYGVSSSFVPCSKIRRKFAPSYKSKDIKQIPSSEKVPPHKPLWCSPFSTTKRLPIKDRPLPGLLSHPHSGAPPKVSFDPLSRQGSPVRLSPFRAFNSTFNLLPDIKLVSNSIKGNRIKNNRIPGRLPVSQSRSCSTPKRLRNNTKVLKPSRLGCQSHKVSRDSDANSRISRHSLGHPKQPQTFTSQEDSINRERFKKHPTEQFLELEDSQKSSGKTQFCLLCNPVRPIACSTPTEGRECIASHASQKTIHPTASCASDVQMVARESRGIISSIPFNTNGIYSNRCIGQGLGSCCKRKTLAGYLDSTPTILAHQQKGTICRTTSSPTQYRNAEQQACCHSVRQLHSSFLHKEGRGDKIATSDQLSVETSPFSSGAKHASVSALHTGNLQRYCRQSVQEETFSRLAPVINSDKQDFSTMGDPGDRPLCIPSVQSCANLRLEGSERQTGPVLGRLQQEVGIQTCMDFPSTLTDSKSSHSSESVKGNLHLDSAQVGESVLESRFKKPSFGSTISNSRSSTPPDRRHDRLSSAEPLKSSFGGMEDTGWSRITSGWRKEDLTLLMSSWRRSSLKTYQAPWRSWTEFCYSHDIVPSKPKVEQVVQYLAFLHRVRKLSPATIKLHKAVIATMSDPLQSEFISSHPLVKRILKGIDLTDPPKNKKVIWDVSQLVEWMRTVPIDENSIFQVARHLALILLLTSGRRVHDLTLLQMDPEHLSLTDDSVIFWPIFGSKTDKSSFRQSGWCLTKIPEERLNPVVWTKKYLNITKKRRSAMQSLNSFFITSRGRVGPASRSTIAGWITTAFSALHINFSPGSIRSAVASSRRDSNVPIDTILRNGNWSSDSNVIKHYFKKIEKSVPENLLVDTLLNQSFTAV